MTHPTAPHPDWQALLNASDADEAMNELQARLDRASEHAPTICSASSGAGQRPIPTPGEHHPQPVASLATGAATGTGVDLHDKATASAVNAAAA